MRFKEILAEDLTKDQRKKISRINNRLESDPDLIDEIWKDLALKAKDIEGQFVNRFITMLDPEKTDPEKDQAFKDFLKKYAQIIAEIDAPTEEKFAFINSLGKKSHINEKNLLSPGKSSWDDWLTGSNFSKKLFEAAYSDPRLITNNKGPGEAALAILSPNITLALGGAGDVVVNGTPVEVKAAAGNATSAGRLIPTKNTLGVYTAKQVAEMLFPNDPSKQSLLIEKYKTCSANAFGNLVQEFDLTPEQIQKLLSNIFREESIQDKVAKVAKKGPQITGRDLLGLSIYNYARSQNDEHFLILVKANRTSLYFRVDQWEQAHGLQFSLALFGNDTRAVGKTQVGILKSA